jgi:hypothetical protein
MKKPLFNVTFHLRRLYYLKRQKDKEWENENVWNIVVHIKVLVWNLHANTEEDHVKISRDIECCGRDIWARLL